VGALVGAAAFLWRGGEWPPQWAALPVDPSDVPLSSRRLTDWGIMHKLNVLGGISVPYSDRIVAGYLCECAMSFDSVRDVARDLSASELDEYKRLLDEAGVGSLATADALFVMSDELSNAYRALGPGARERCYVFLESAAIGRDFAELEQRLENAGVSVRAAGSMLLVRADQKYKAQRVIESPTFVGVLWEWYPQAQNQLSAVEEFLEKSGLEFLPGPEGRTVSFYVRDLVTEVNEAFRAYAYGWGAPDGILDIELARFLRDKEGARRGKPE